MQMCHARYVVIDRVENIMEHLAAMVARVSSSVASDEGHYTNALVSMLGNKNLHQSPLNNLMICK